MGNAKDKMKEKILVIGTGGTVACEKSGDTISLENTFKITEYSDKIADFICKSPFSILSENMNFEYLSKLITFIKNQNAKEYAGIIILHGSDTLAYTGAVLANIFYNENICLTAADKPIEDKSSNGIKNFNNAARHISKNKNGVYISYDGIFNAQTLTSADGFDKFGAVGKCAPEKKNPTFNPKNILIIKPYPGICYDSYNLGEVDAVLHEMYHSATVCESAKDFLKKCEELKIPFYFVTPKSRAEYETAKDIKEHIIFNSTTENAYARLLLE